MSKARQLADNGAASPNRNLVINGAMNVAQRATSVTGIGASAGAGYFTCDRWAINAVSTGGRLTMTQTADGPVGFANCVKLDCTTADASIAAGEALTLEQHIEGQNLQRIGKGETGAQQITVSFYVKANAAFNFGLELFDNDNSRQITKLFATTTDWVKHSITFPADVDDGSSPFDDDNAVSLYLFFWLHAGSTYTGGTLNTAAFANNSNANRAVGIDSFLSSTDNNFFLTGVQMEVGEAATPFEHKTFAEDLVECQRYYYKLVADSAFSTLGRAMANTATASVINPLGTYNMRAVPSLDSTAASTFLMQAGNVNETVSAIAINSHASRQSPQLDITNGSTTAGFAGSFMANNATSSYIAFDAEL